MKDLKTLTLILKIYGTKEVSNETQTILQRARDNNLTIVDLKDLSLFVLNELKEKGKTINVKYFKSVIEGIEYTRLQIVGCFHGQRNKNASSVLCQHISDCAGIKVENESEILETDNEFLIEFLEDLLSIKELKRENDVQTGAYGGKFW